MQLRRDGAVAYIAIVRPDKRNALDDACVLALEAMVNGLQAETEVQALVLHAEGDNFCAGLDLSEVRERDAAEGLWHSRMWHRALSTLESGRLPVVAVLKGAVVGGGLELASATHIRVAEESTFYALPEGQRGIYVGGGGSVRVPRLIGVARMMDMMLTGRTYSGHEGVALGFSQYAVANGEGLAKATELEARVRGPNIMPGYWRQPELTAAAVDADGFYKLGDALRFADPADLSRGFVFDGRISEDFKLATGTWVSVGPLRAALTAACAPLVRDAVLAGINEDEATALLVPDLDACRALCPDLPACAPATDVMAHPGLRRAVQAMLATFALRAMGSARRVTRAVLLATPPSLDAGEITDKGSLNQGAVLRHRADLVAALYAVPRPAFVIDATDERDTRP